METTWGRILRPSNLLAITVAFYGFAAVLVAALLLWADHAETFRQSETSTRDIVRLLQEHASRTLDGT